MAAWLSILLSPAAAPPAYYLDPGSGSYLIQLVVAGALGALLALRMSWGRIKGMFRPGQPPEDDKPEEHDG